MTKDSLCHRSGFVTKGSPCHRFGRIVVGVCSRVAAGDACLCLRSSSDLLVGRDWAVAMLTRTLPMEEGLQSERVVVGQHAGSLSSLELDVRLVAYAEELVATLALSKAQCLLRTLLGDMPRS